MTKRVLYHVMHAMDFLTPEKATGITLFMSLALGLAQLDAKNSSVAQCKTPLKPLILTLHPYR